MPPSPHRGEGLLTLQIHLLRLLLSADENVPGGETIAVGDGFNGIGGGVEEMEIEFFVVHGITPFEIVYAFFA